MNTSPPRPKPQSFTISYNSSTEIHEKIVITGANASSLATRMYDFGTIYNNMYEFQGCGHKSWAHNEQFGRPTNMKIQCTRSVSRQRHYRRKKPLTLGWWSCESGSSKVQSCREHRVVRTIPTLVRSATRWMQYGFIFTRKPSSLLKSSNNLTKWSIQQHLSCIHLRHSHTWVSKYMQYTSSLLMRRECPFALGKTCCIGLDTGS